MVMLCSRDSSLRSGITLPCMIDLVMFHLCTKTLWNGDEYLASAL